MKTQVIKELENPCTNDYLNFKKEVHGNELPWYYLQKTIKATHISGQPIMDFSQDEDIPFYGHQLMGRPDKLGGEPYSKITSPWFEKAYTVLKQIFTHNKMEVSVIYRMNLNAMFFVPTQITKSIFHTDLEFPHQSLIIYLSKFEGGHLYVKNDTEEMEFSPQEDEIFLFNGRLQHSVGLPQGKERRIVMVANIL